MDKHNVGEINIFNLKDYKIKGFWFLKAILS